MTIDPLMKLEATIEASARDRDLKDQQSRDELTAKERFRNEAQAVWATRKGELPAIVQTVDRMLKQNGYGGLVTGVFDLKHPDIDRVLINFEHNVRTYSKILLCATRAGDFTCSISAVSGDAYFVKLPMGELTTLALKETLSQAVVECLTGAWAPRSERTV